MKALCMQIKELNPHSHDTQMPNASTRIMDDTSIITEGKRLAALPVVAVPATEVKPGKAPVACRRLLKAPLVTTVFKFVVAMFAAATEYTVRVAVRRTLVLLDVVSMTSDV